MHEPAKCKHVNDCDHILVIGFVIGILLLVAIPLYIHSAYLIFRKYRNHKFIRKRKIELLVACYVYWGIYVFIWIPIDTLAHPFELFDLSLNASFLINCVLIDGFGVLTAIRFVYLFLCIRRIQDSKRWRKQIDPKFKSFVLLHFHIIGNLKYLFIAGAIFWAVIATIQALTFEMAGSDDIHHGMFCFIGVNGVSFIAFGVLLFRTIWRFADYWKIKKELLLIFIVSICQIGTLLSVALLINDKALVLVWWSLSLLLSSMVYLIISSYVVIHLIQKQQNKYTHNHHATQPELLSMLSSLKGYELIQKHMEKEFSQENILFFTELIQFGDYLLKHHFIDEKALFAPHFQLPKDIPLSPILASYTRRRQNHNTTNSGNLHNAISMIPIPTSILNISSAINTATPNSKAESLLDEAANAANYESNDRSLYLNAVAPIYKALFEKYLKRKTSCLEVNISYVSYQKLLSVYNDILETNTVSNIDDLWMALCSASREIIANMLDSFRRFSFDNIVAKRTVVSVETSSNKRPSAT